MRLWRKVILLLINTLLGFLYFPYTVKKSGIPKFLGI